MRKQLSKWSLLTSFPWQNEMVWNKMVWDEMVWDVCQQVMSEEAVNLDRNLELRNGSVVWFVSRNGKNICQT